MSSVQKCFRWNATNVEASTSEGSSLFDTNSLETSLSSLDGSNGDGGLMRTEPAPPEASSPILEGEQGGEEEEEAVLARQGQGGRQTYNVL